MKTRRENLLDAAAVRLVIDPMLSSSRVKAKLRSNVQKESRLIRFVLRHCIDPTILPPPSYTRARADQVYGDAFRRCVEYLAGTRLKGDILEFGSLLGYTGRWLAGLIREYDLPANLSLFDSFEGLPDIASHVDAQSYEVLDNGPWFKGAMKVDGALDQRIRASLSRILPADRLRVVKGYFENTLEAHLPEQQVALLHLDCDLYASARFVLDRLLQGGLHDGALLICDDYNSNRANPEMGERRAITDAFAAQDRYTFSPWFSYGWHGQVFFIHDLSHKQDARWKSAA